MSSFLIFNNNVENVKNICYNKVACLLDSKNGGKNEKNKDYLYAWPRL